MIALGERGAHLLVHMGQRNQVQSNEIHGNPVQSSAINGNPVQSSALKCTQVQSMVIKCNQWQSSHLLMRSKADVIPDPSDAS